MIEVHSTAMVHPEAVIGDGTTIGPYSIIGPNVRVGTGNQIGSHVFIDGHTTIGDENEIFPFASVGSKPQDLKFRGEKSELIIGKGNIIREYVTLQPGTSGGGMKTLIGDQNLFMVGFHVAHDCTIGSYNVFANYSSLAGHVQVGNQVTIGGMAGVHQFCRLGDLAILGAGAMVAKDVPPFCMVQGDRAVLAGLNRIGLKRRNYSSEEITIIKNIYRTVFLGGGTLSTRIEAAGKEVGSSKAGSDFIKFLTAPSKRGFVHARRGAGQEELGTD